MSSDKSDLTSANGLAGEAANLNASDSSPGESITISNSSPLTQLNGSTSASVPADLYPGDLISVADQTSTLGDTLAAAPFIYQDAQPGYASSILPGDTRFLAEGPAAATIFNTWTSLLDPHIAAAEAMISSPSPTSADSILSAPAS